MEFKDLVKNRRLEIGKTLEEIGNEIGVSKATVQRWESGEIKDIRRGKLVDLAKALQVEPGYLMDWGKKPMSQPATAQPATAGAALVSFPVIAAVKAGYDGQAREEYTGSLESIPAEDLHGRSPEDFMVLRVNGNSMYPLLLDGDRILVERTTSVDSGALAVVLYNGEDATVKRVRYKYGEDWLELLPQNPEYPPKRIEGPDLEECRVLGRVLKLIRTLE